MDTLTLSSAIRPFCLLANAALTSSGFWRHFSSKYLHEAFMKTLSLMMMILSQFRDKNCSVPQVRIFALLSLCSTPSRIKVSYEETPIYLTRNILKSHTGPACLCAIVMISRGLNLSKDAFATKTTDNKSGQDWDSTYVEIDMLSIQMKTVPKYFWVDPSSSDFLYLDSGSVCPTVHKRSLGTLQEMQC